MPDKNVDNTREILKDRRICIVMTGSISCYKVCDVVSRLVRRGAAVRVVMTRNAARFITPMTMEALTGAPVALDTFGGKGDGWNTRHLHIELARFGEVIGVIPATGNFIGKMAAGIADDLAGTIILSTTAPVLVAPSMNRRIYENRVVQANLQRLKGLGYYILEPDEGFLSCGEYGFGRLPDRETIVEELINILRKKDCLQGKRVLVSAGRTEEPFDPVRYLTNRSSGRMGYAIARAARRFGAEVTLVSGPAELRSPRGVRLIRVRSAAEMSHALEGEMEGMDMVVMAAAVCDFTPSSCSSEKLRREGAGISLGPTEDILQMLSAKRVGKNPLMIGFAMETSDLEVNARHKLEKKGIDIIVANNPLEVDSGFGEDFIQAIIIDHTGVRERFPRLEKDILAERLLEFAVRAM